MTTTGRLCSKIRCWTVVLAGAAAVLGAPGLRAESAKPDLSGAWKLNPELTARLMQKQAEEEPAPQLSNQGGRGRSGPTDAPVGGLNRDRGAGAGKHATGADQGRHDYGTGLPLQGSLKITQQGDQVTISDNQGGSVVLKTDGKKLRAAAAPGGPAEMRASWERDGTLRVEVRPEKGPKRTESYVVSNDRKHLYVTISTQRPTGEAVQLIGAYDPAPAGEPEPEKSPAAPTSTGPPATGRQLSRRV
jgi:hypothetical protein